RSGRGRLRAPAPRGEDAWRAAGARGILDPPLPDPLTMKLSIVMPAYNEGKTIREIVGRVLSVDLGDIEKELVIVDDGSTDGTRDILKEMDGKHSVRVILQPVNMGKGAAVWTGMQASSGDIVIIQDADLEYDPEEYPIVLGPILAAKADVVYGSRFLGSPH